MQFNITFKTTFEYVLKKLVLCIQIRFVSTEKTTRIASRASCYYRSLLQERHEQLSTYYAMCSLALSTQDSSAVEPRSNPGSGKILMSENLRLCTTSPVVMC